MGKPVQSGLKQMSRSKPAKGCGVGGHVVGWQGQLTDGPVDSRPCPIERTVTSTHRSFPGRLSRRRPLSAGAATAGAALAGCSAGPAWAAGKPIPTRHASAERHPPGGHHRRRRPVRLPRIDRRRFGPPRRSAHRTGPDHRPGAGHGGGRAETRRPGAADVARLPRSDPAAQSSEESSSSVPVSGRGDFGGFGRPPGLSRRYEELSLPSAVACPPGAGPAGPPPSRRRR